MLIQADRSVLLVVHIQEKLAPAVDGPERVIKNVGTLMTAAERLGVPVLVPELNPDGLGPTVAAVAKAAPAGAIVPEMHFSCMGDGAFAGRFNELGKDQVVVTGTEAHVCVLQACMDLLAVGRSVFVVADAVSSRLPENARLGLERLRAAGAGIVSTEMVVFEWMGRADRPEFKELLALIK